jgi:probable phosphoglycerate mutase
MKFYFVRHGESKANLLREFSNRGFKHGLTERGVRQAERLAVELRGINFAKIYTSPLKRAYQTAEILSRYQDCPFDVTDALREFDTGVLEGTSDPAGWELHSQVFQQWLVGAWEARIPGGESHLEIQARFLPFIEGLLESFTGENVLLVGHGGTMLSMLPLILENIDFDFVRDHHIDHTVPIIAEIRPAGLYCVQWGELRVASG